MATSASGELQIEEDFGFQRRMGRFQRIGQGLLVLGLLAALSGFVGNGPVSRREIRSPSGQITLRFDEFARYDAPQQFEVELGASRTIEFWIDSTLARSLEIESVVPTPARTSASSEQIRFEILSPSGAHRTSVIIRCRALSVGRIQGRIGTAAENVTLSQFVYP